MNRAYNDKAKAALSERPAAGAARDAPPVFLKLHKVGSTTAAGFFECAQRRGVFPERCSRADARLKGAFPPWRHGTARAYALHGSAPFRDADCPSFL